MAHKVPICPYGHLSRRQPAVVVLAISSRGQDRRIGGFAIKPSVQYGVDVHCTECHLEGWISVDPEWKLDTSDSPRACSCGVVSEIADQRPQNRIGSPSRS